MTDTTKNILLFIGGVIWAMKSSKKAYAPPLTTNNQILPSKPVEPQVVGGNCGSTCGGYENPNYNSALPYSETNKPCICEGPGTANPSPQSQADCAEGLVFYQSYPCGIPGCDWNKECITPAEKIMRDKAPPLA
tara:strand:+ start:1262 stop:1663 length:402 start_codon:yes stop_codon:yes gene_type:complete